LQTRAQGWRLVDLLIPNDSQKRRADGFFPGAGGSRSIMLRPKATPLSGYEKHSLRITKTRTDAQGALWSDVRDIRSKATYTLHKQNYRVVPYSISSQSKGNLLMPTH
jgi:hypothetical protein